MLLVAGGGAARAHQSSVVYSDIVVRGREVHYTLQLSSTDLYEAVGVERDRPVSQDEVRSARAHLEQYLIAHVKVESGGASCGGEPAGLEFLGGSAPDSFFAVVKLVYRCPRTVAEALVRYDLFFDVDPRHQGIARLSFGDEEGREQVFRDGARTLTVRRDLSLWDHVSDYLVLGVEHIFTGYDHLAFLFGLLVIVGASARAGSGRAAAKKVLTVVSAFTLAHSVTLIASALGWVALPSRIVEPAIAASIAYIAVENLVNPSPRFRWLVTFGFGLVHGFGFASVLREIGLPHKGLLLCLVSFNVGVEVGQLTVVAAVLPLLALIVRSERPSLSQAGAVALIAVGGFVVFRRFGVPPLPLGLVCFAAAPSLGVLGRRFGYDRVVRLGGSVAIGLLAIFWFVERVLGRSFAGGWLG